MLIKNCEDGRVYLCPNCLSAWQESCPPGGPYATPLRAVTPKPIHERAQNNGHH
jgi:hypothetical protein